MNSEDFNQLIGAFIAETKELLQSLEANLLVLERSDQAEVRLQAVKDLFRSAHSIKGAALMFRFEALSKAAHSLENSFAILRDRANLADLNPEIVTKLLDGVDILRRMTERVWHGEQGAATEGDEIQAMAQIKVFLEATFGKEEPPAISAANAPANYEVIKAIFQSELPPVLNQLETDFSQAQAETLTETKDSINQIYLKLSALAGMLQLPDFGRAADQLDTLLNLPHLTLELLQKQGWAIAQNLQLARQQILAGQLINVPLVELLPVVASPSSDLVPVLEPQLVSELITRETLASNLVHQVETITSLQPPEVNPTLKSTVLANSPNSDNSAANWQRPTIRVEVERLTELVNLVGELVINRTNLETQESQLRSEIKRIRQSIAELNHSGSQLREEYDRMSVAPLRTPKPQGIVPETQPGSFDTLEMDQYTEFHSTAQAVIETSQTISQSAIKIDQIAFKFDRSTDHLRRITDQLRSKIMQLRVVAFSRAVDHLPRAVRDLSRTYQKDVNLLLLGRDTKIDETLLDALRDPLVHLVRNAFDHGIEPPDLRLKLGKPPMGQIEIAASHQGGQTIITITDDGRGIDPERIRRRIVEKELVPMEQAQDLGISDLYEFLFWPGFSTVDTVTDLSGRGVGLDVVRTNLRQVRGTVKVDSRLGQGTTFILKLPLMLSITDALMVKTDHNVVAVPMDAVEEILHIQASQTHMAGNQPMLYWREEFIRLVRLQDLLHYSVLHPDGPSPDPLAQEYIPVLVLGASEGVVAIAVERLIGQQEIVVKPLPSPLSKPQGIVGCTILGDGRVVMILDVDDLVGQLTPQVTTAVSIGDKRPQILAPVPNSQPQILVVDDSYTIRQLLALTLTRARYRVIQAKDGQDALEKLESGISCSLVLADIEMPRMDGFELLKALKVSPTLASIPVAMLTSRSGSKHRQMALDLGAIHYFTKPYSEAQLLEVIAKLLHT